MDSTVKLTAGQQYLSGWFNTIRNLLYDPSCGAWRCASEQAETDRTAFARHKSVQVDVDLIPFTTQSVVEQDELCVEDIL